MKTIPRPLYWFLTLLTVAVDAVVNPIQAWMNDHPEVKQWLGVFRLGLIQFGIGLSIAPISGTLNRVLITDLKIPAAAVGFLIALHYFVSPIRVMIGYRSDKARAEGVWRTPYVVLGVMLTYGGLACAPFALIILSGEGLLTFWPALLICTLIFAAYGAGINIVETIYLALVSDITPPKSRAKVITVLWVMLVLGTVVSAVIVSGMLVDYSHKRLIQVMQGSAIVFVILTVIALRGQERLRRDGSIISRTETTRVRMGLWQSIGSLREHYVVQWLFAVIFIATIAFATHDVLLEPYGGEVLGMSVSSTMQLTALWGAMTIVGVVGAGVLLWQKVAPSLLISMGCVVGLAGFGVISYASEAMAVSVFQVGVGLVSMGRGLFIVGSVILVMSQADISHAGLFLGIWGIVQALAQGFGVIGGGLLRDVQQSLTGSVALGYTSVYMTSFMLLAVVVLALVFRVGPSLEVNQIRLPWDDGMEEIPADQLTF